MQEDFLHYLWRLKRFDLSELKTTQGESIDIQRAGDYNRHAGPDFTNARIRIGDTLWAGNVEMHLRASDWMRHRHQEDEAYENVILHVVLEEDQPVQRANGEHLPCLELKRRIPHRLSKIYQKLVHNEYWIPCQPQLPGVSLLTRRLWMDRLLVERLEQKTEEIRKMLERNQRNWEETFFQCLARNFGVKVNAEPFEQLARSIPLQLIRRHRHNLLQVEALLFGQAGLLNPSYEDEYPRRLRREYQHLSHMYKLETMEPAAWKFLRLRPANFPTIRLAQLAMLLHQSGQLFSKTLAVQNVKEIEHMFEIHLSNYWKTHYLFDKESKRQTKSLGRSTIHLFVINTIAPFLFFYGRERRADKFQERALQLLEELPPENNHIIRNWKNLDMEPQSAYQSQALLQLKKNYCDQRRCLECAIGNAILK